MKLIEAVWDKESLGVESYEIEFEIGDSVSNLKKYMDSICDKCNGLSALITLKIPSGYSISMSEVQNEDFVFVEDLITVEHYLQEITRDRITQRMYDSMTYRRMSSEDVDQLKDEIRRGLFSTDRISLDPRFGIEVAAKRYIHWVDDLLAMNAIPYLLIYKDDPEGFIILKDNHDNTYTSVLGGAYEKYRKTGIGIVQKEQEIVKLLGGKKVYTTVSSNNVGQLKALIKNGYVPVNIEHVFVKHI